MPRISPHSLLRLRTLYAHATQQFIRFWRHPRWAKIISWRALVTLFVVLFIFLATALLVLRFSVWQNSAKLKSVIEQFASNQLNAQLTIEQLQTDWDGLHPRFDMRNLVLRNHQGQIVGRLQHSQGTFSWVSLLKLSPRLQQLDINDIDLAGLREPDGQIIIAGFPIRTDNSQDAQLPEWLLDSGAVKIKNLRLHWRNTATALSASAMAPTPANATSTVVLTIPDLQIHSNGTKVDLKAQLTAPLFAAPVQLETHFSHRLLGTINHWQDWVGQLNWTLPDVDLAQLQDAWPLFAAIKSGTFNSSGSLHFDTGELTQLQGSVTLANIALQINPQLPTLDLKQANSTLHYQRKKNQHQLQIERLHWQHTLDPQQETLQPLLFTWENQDKHPGIKRLELNTPNLPIAPLIRLAQSLPLPAALLETLNKLAPQGYLNKVHISWEAPSPHIHRASNPRYTIRAQLQNVGINAQVGSWPGFNHLSGTLIADQNTGSLNIDSKQVTLVLPDFFDIPTLPLQQIQGNIAWEGSGKNLQLSSTGLSFANTDIRGTVSGRYLSDTDHLTLNGVLDYVALQKIARYLPKQIDRDTRQFFTEAKLSGEARLARINVQGTLRTFPYKDVTQGLFQIDIPVYQASLLIPSDPYIAYSPNQAIRSPPQALHTPLKAKINNHLVSCTTRICRDNHLTSHTDPQHNTPASQYTRTIDEVVHVAQQPIPKKSRHWPAIEKIEGNVSLKQSALQFDFARARIYDAQLKNVHGLIANLYDDAPRLKITGEATGPTQDFLRFVVQSPLTDIPPDVVKEIFAQGNGKLSLKLDIPLTGSEVSQVEGRYTLLNNHVTLQPKIAPIRSVSGEIYFTQAMFQLYGLRGHVAGGPINVSGGTQANDTFRLKIYGNAQAQGLRSAIANTPALPLFDHINGALHYQGELHVVDSRPELHLQTDLTGLNLTLPYPFDKPQGQTLIAHLHWRQRQDTHEDLTLHLGNWLKVHYLLTPDQQGYMTASHGTIRMHSPSATSSHGAQSCAKHDLTHHGVCAHIELDKLNVDQWEALLQKANTASSNERTATSVNQDLSSYFPNHIHVQIGQLQLLNRTFDNLNTTVTHTAAQWQAQIDATQISGQISWTPPNPTFLFGKLSARLERLYIPNAITQTNGIIPTDLPHDNPNGLPSLHVVTNDFQINNIHFGQLELIAHGSVEKNQSLWNMDKLLITHPAATLKISGDWSMPAAQTTLKHTTLNFALNILDGGQLLTDIGVPKTLMGGKGDITGDLHWHGSPLHVDYNSLDGHVTLNLQKGQLLRVDAGAAKLLGILSLQNLFHLAIFDLRGLASSGIPFNRVSATIDLNKGIAHSKDFKMESSVATVEMHGFATIKDETQNFQVAVTPHIDIGSASLAYATLINPLLGLSSLVLQNLLGASLGQALAQTYNVTGSWTNPIITRTDQFPTTPLP